MASRCRPRTPSSQSGGQCSYLEGAFEEGFQSSSLNTSRWASLAQTTMARPVPHGPITRPPHCAAVAATPARPAQVHCPVPGAVGAANAATCTAVIQSQHTLGTPLPNYPGGALGLIMTLSQTPCSGVQNSANPCCVCGPAGGASAVGAANALGCTGGNALYCANWAGAHLSSNGCILYGVLEAEAAISIPLTSGGIGFFGTYMFGGAGAVGGTGTDPSWNGAAADDDFVHSCAAHFSASKCARPLEQLRRLATPRRDRPDPDAWCEWFGVPRL